METYRRNVNAVIIVGRRRSFYRIRTRRMGCLDRRTLEPIISKIVIEIEVEAWQVINRISIIALPTGTESVLDKKCIEIKVEIEISKRDRLHSFSVWNTQLSKSSTLPHSR